MRDKIKNISFAILMIAYMICTIHVEFIWFDAGWMNYAIGFVFTIVPFIGGFVLGMIYKDKLIENWNKQKLNEHKSNDKAWEK